MATQIICDICKKPIPNGEKAFRGGCLSGIQPIRRKFIELRYDLHATTAATDYDGRAEGAAVPLDAHLPCFISCFM